MSRVDKLVYPELSYKLVGILFTVHNELGRYCNEKQYCDKIEYYLKKLKVPFEREKVLEISFEGERKGRNKVDFIIDNKILLEVKAKRLAGKEDYFQLRRYLRALNKELGILVNFRSQYINPKRILNASMK